MKKNSHLKKKKSSSKKPLEECKSSQKNMWRKISTKKKSVNEIHSTKLLR